MLNISGALLEKAQLEKYLEKIASEHNIQQKSDKTTYPLPQTMQEFKFITKVYQLLNSHVKQGISIHPAGEWLLDNYYIINENIKILQDEVTLKEYTNLPGIATGEYKGYARIYILALEIAAHTDNKIEKETIENAIYSYQKRKILNMQEMWSIQNFLKIAVIKNIAKVCEKIYITQIQKEKVISVIQSTIENQKSIYKKPHDINYKHSYEMKYAFVEYLSYKLKKYGKLATPYIEVLEEQVNRTGTTIEEIITKQHYSVALAKVSIGNAIISLKNISRISFQEIFESQNGVEEILKKDPIGIYEKMSYDTKAYYRKQIQKMAEKTRISEIYVVNKALELAKENIGKDKKEHIGYYLIDNGKDELLKKLGVTHKTVEYAKKARLYIFFFMIFTSILTIALSGYVRTSASAIIAILILILAYIPVSEIYLKILNMVVLKQPEIKRVPKIDMSQGIPAEDSTFVVIPTILNSTKKVKELAEKLEVYYLANKSENIYFAILGDCTNSTTMEEKLDKEIIKQGKTEIERLNNKYKAQEFPKFHFLYRKRKWCATEKIYLGWERKRGLLTQFNKMLITKKKMDFSANSILENENTIPAIRYIITLDSDTKLSLNTGLKLIGAMAHPLNKPKVNNNIVTEGYGIIQPRVGIDLDDSKKSLFTEIFGGTGGVDSYTNAVSDVYQDNFQDAIYMGKGIYDLNIFYNLLDGSIAENTVLSHDLLEANYLKCGFATDILVLDGCPSKYNSFTARNQRWIRGDWQIVGWLGDTIENQEREKIKNPIGVLSKFKIFDNLRRSLLPVAAVLLLLLGPKPAIIPTIAITSIVIPTVLDIIYSVINRKEVTPKQYNFTRNITGIPASILRAVLEVAFLPDKAYTAIEAISKTLYRLKTKEKLLQWTTSEEMEKISKTDLLSYYKKMAANVILGIILLFYLHPFTTILGFIWLIAPTIAWYISKDNTNQQIITKDEKDYIRNVAKKTWGYFNQYMNEENNFLPPDNVQESKIATRTSSTNIGLGLLAIISAYDLGFIEKEETISRIQKTLETIEKLDKWHGHLYNWYNTITLQPLIPRYVSTVDSGNFIGYLYVIKQFLINENEQRLVAKIEEIIENTDFSLLYDNGTGLFSVGYNIEENKLTDSYYDFLASEARQASIIAIAKKDIPAKHWDSMSRTLTTVNGYKGLISWSGTAFEYLMPNMTMKNYKGSLLNESSKFALMNQKSYVKKLQIPWGISESAYNLKDLNGNYQYKAFGIPVLGQKRGLGDELVISPYGSALGITEEPIEVIENLKQLESIGMLGKYGFYEAVDYTPGRLKHNQKYSIIKAYMAHHQGLILLAITNLLKNNVFVERFSKNPEIQAIDILLQERMPNNIVIKREEVNKKQKLKYANYKTYSERVYNYNTKLPKTNILSNREYTIFTTLEGMGFSKFKDVYINRYKKTADEKQGIIFYIKNIKNKKLWSPSILDKNTEVVFTEDTSRTKHIEGNIETICKTTIASEDMVEIRKLEIKNTGIEDEVLEITNYFEPSLSRPEEDYAHPAFNNLFLQIEKHDEGLVIERTNKENPIYVATNLYTENECVGELEYETDKTRFLGRNNIGIPELIKLSKPFQNKTVTVVEPIIAQKRTLKIRPDEKVTINLLISVGENKQDVLKTLVKYQNQEKIENEFELSKARADAENRYLEVTNQDMELYQKMFTYLIHKNPLKKLQNKNMPANTYHQNQLWKYGISGDNPILFLKIKDLNDLDVLDELLKFYEYSRVKNIRIDLVIQNQEENSYEKYVKHEIENVILNNQLTYLMNDGIYIVENLDKSEERLIEFVSKITIDAQMGNAKTIINELEEESKKTTNFAELENIDILYTTEEKTYTEKLDPEKHRYYNEFGGFSADGKEYHIIVDKNRKLPNVWSHVMANEHFGTVVTDNMGGYTWARNSRLNRITAWSNNPTTDVPSEIIYFRNEDTGKVWTMNHGIIPDENDYSITYGFGYAKYKHICDGIIQENEVFIPRNDNIKINILNIKNTEPKNKKLKLIYYIKPVMGEDEIKTNSYINTAQQENSIYIRNLYGSEKIVYIMTNQNIKSYTASKEQFIGKGSLENPEGLLCKNLIYENALGSEAGVAVQIEIDLDAYEAKQIILGLGEGEQEEITKTVNKYSYVETCKIELEKIKMFWKQKVSMLQVKTPLESVNIMLNGWILYQTIVCRMWAKTSFYQSGGAFGFRDQLQDVIGLQYLDEDALKEQILRASTHQFIEGDVEHWWHEETSMGIRTRFSDDLLWLCYAVAEYIKCTGDKSILEEKTPYREGKLLNDEQEECYDYHPLGTIEGTIYEHCIKAIEKGTNLGKNGLIKIGTGDWNDGFSTVGNKGIGESVWVSFFLYDILKKFIPICQEKGDIQLVEKYTELKERLRKNINQNAWDGRWFKRAYTDDGEALGSIANDECKIDSIAQTWSVISGAGDNDKKFISMENLENYLVDSENGIIKLLTPAFKDSKLNPGYIKSYPIGVRENGGQYTHAAIWVVIAEALLGFGNKALEYYRMINPVEHARTKDAAQKYKGEPYVISADVYSNSDMLGRSGWSWYTGSSSWYYRAGIEYILGLKIEDERLRIEPCIPREWIEYSIRYKYKSSIYNINVKNPNAKNTGVATFRLNGREIPEKTIKLIDDGKINEITIEI